MAAALATSAVVAIALLLRAGSADGGLQGRPSPALAATPTVGATVDERRVALEKLLETRSRAVLTGDRAAWMSTVDPLATEFAARQAQVFDNLAAVPFASWNYELAGNGPGLSAARALELGADDVSVVRAVLEYQLDDPETGVVRREQHLTLTERGGRWSIADNQDGGTAVDLWDLGPVVVTRGGRALVLGTADQGVVSELAAEVDRAAADVDAVWGTDWPRTVVVMVPGDQAQMAALLGREDDRGLEQIAAVTTGEVGVDSSATSADRVIVNPDGFAELGPVGRQVVLRHEISHVATRATSTVAVPIWLSEGLADYVAYRDTGLDARDVARDVLDEVREGRPPTALPDATAFDPAVSDIAPAYSGAWLAAHLIVETYGQDKLLQFYRAVASGSSGGGSIQPPATPGGRSASQAAVDAAFRSVLGTDEASFTEAWQDEMARLAG